jgi:hypothetical protein
MKTKAISFIIIFTMTIISANKALANKRCVIIDILCHQPIDNASVTVDGHLVLKSDASGFVDLPNNFATVEFDKTFYEKLVLRNSELRDTVFLSSTSYRLGEVVIYGIKPKNNYPKFRVDKDELAMIWYKTQPTNLLNLVKLVADKIFTHGTDERQKRKRIIDNY